MKLFDYECKACDKTFEELQQGDEVIKCPTCQQPAIKLITFQPTQKQDPKMAEYSIKFRKARNKYLGVSKDQMPRIK